MFSEAEFYAESFEKKKTLKKLHYCRCSPDPENSQQPFNFFSVFADFRTLPIRWSVEAEKLLVKEFHFCLISIIVLERPGISVAIRCFLFLL